jgi:hypothetical protein
MKHKYLFLLHNLSAQSSFTVMQLYVTAFSCYHTSWERSGSVQFAAK